MRRRGLLAALALSLLPALACETTTPEPVGPARYRLTESGEGWERSGEDPVLEDLRERYPEFLDAVLDPSHRGDFDIRPIRRDIEHQPVDRHNFDALNAVAISYFELNHRAQSAPGGAGYFDDSFRAAKLLAIPWSAYARVPDPRLRDAILDFFEDAGRGDKLDAASTAPRLARIVASLEDQEQDEERLERIRDLVEDLEDD